MLVHFVLLGIFLSSSFVFAATNYPLPIPPDFKNAPYKIVCEDALIPVRLEEYTNPQEGWYIHLSVRNGKEEMILAAGKNYFKLFHFIDAGWKNRDEMSEEEVKKWYDERPRGEDEERFRQGCLYKFREFESKIRSDVEK